MTNCCLGMLRGIWSFLMGSLRMILFFMCLIYTLVLALFAACLILTAPSINLDVPALQTTFSDYLLLFGLVALGLLGAYGAFYKHHPSIKAFSLLSALNTLVLILMVFYTLSPEAVNHKVDEAMNQFKSFMSSYKWDSNHQDVAANRNWDFIQRLTCCGVDGPNDWNKYRPSNVPDNAYPASCCIHKETGFDLSQTCTKKNAFMFFDTGCSERLRHAAAVSFMLYCLLIGYQMLLSVMSYMIGYCGLESRQTHHVMHVAVPRAGNPTSVYVAQPYQQPPVNRDFVDGGVPKHSLPPMYPNLNNGNVNYSAPPPSYGT